MKHATKTLPLDWLNISFLSGVHVAAIIGALLYLLIHGPTLAAFVIGAVWTTMTIFAISAGYHRLFSHRTYEAHPVFRLVCLLFGAAAFQNSAIAWASDHRRHHSRVDSDLDPYDARRGFWHAHIGWVLRKTDPDIPPTPVKDLERDRLVMWQHEYYPLIGIVMGFVAPFLVGLAFGDPWGALIMGGPVRLVVAYHATFAVNSVAHMLGSQPYSDEDTSRDSLITALITMGEGYHNYHHTFPVDYRMGPRVYQYDPTKWVIRGLSFIGVTRRLRRASAEALDAAKMRMAERRAAAKARQDERRAAAELSGALPS